MQTLCARAKSNVEQHNPSTNICVLLCLMMTLIRTEYCLLAEGSRRRRRVYIIPSNSAVDSLVIDTGHNTKNETRLN